MNERVERINILLSSLLKFIERKYSVYYSDPLDDGKEYFVCCGKKFKITLEEL